MCMEVHGSETWSVKTEKKLALNRAEVRMIGWMCGVILRDKLSCIELRQCLAIEDIITVIQRNKCDGMVRFYLHTHAS